MSAEQVAWGLVYVAGGVFGLWLARRARRDRRVDFAVNLGLVAWFAVALAFVEQQATWLRVAEVFLLILGSFAVRRSFAPSGAGCLIRGHDPAVVAEVNGGVVRLHANTPAALREGLQHITERADATIVGTSCERCGKVL